MPLASTPEIIAELKAGKMVILVDEEDRENEGDLVLAAEFVTPEAIPRHVIVTDEISSQQSAAG